MTAFADLCTMSNFTFLTGASHPEELAARAAELSLTAFAIADRNTLAGVVRAHTALREMAREAEAKIRSSVRIDSSSRQQRGGQLKTVGVAKTGFAPALPAFLTATRLELSDSVVTWIALPTDRTAYGRLCRLLTLGKRRTEKGRCLLSLADVREGAEGMILLAMVPEPGSGHDDIAEMVRYRTNSVYLAVAPRYDGQDRQRIAAFARMAETVGCPMVAVTDALMHRAKRRAVADVLSCLRLGETIDSLGQHAQPHAERRMRSGDEMLRYFADFPEAVTRTVDIAARCTFRLDELAYDYPDEGVGGETAQDRLIRLTDEGLRWRYPAGIPARSRALADKEIDLINKLNYAPYFLTVHDLVTFARSKNILCQGRGSAANSVVCFALGVTEIAPETISMVFERFVSEARNEPPDIDVDFEHERREEVIQYIYERYGREKSGLCATVIHFRARAAIREVGKAMGLSVDVTSALAGQIWGWSNEAVADERLREIGLDPQDRRLRMTLHLIEEIIGFPRHLSQHVGGFIMTRGRLDELVPIENAAMDGRTCIEWDKDDIDALGILKVDVLALGMLTCMRKGLDLLHQHHGQHFTLATMPKEDPRVYDMLCEADSLGVFQVESRAQMNFLPRMRPRCFYDLVIEVAIIRPGPIQGDMVHPYIRRRNGEEKVDFPSEELRDVLGKTMGVPLFQEQAMKIAIVAAGYSAEEADMLRRSLATFRKTGSIKTHRERFIGGMIERGYDPAFAERCFSQIEGFGEYGFPESHAASFALLVYASSWLKRHHPAIFACALLNSQPMGFYAPAQIIGDARNHGVEVRPVDVNASEWDCTIERDHADALALRLGFRMIKGFREEDAAWIVAARGNGYPDGETVWRRAGVRPDAIERLAGADSLSGTRRAQLWEAKGLGGEKPLPLFADQPMDLDEPKVTLPESWLGEEVVADYTATRFSLRAHPVGLLRDRLKQPAIPAKAARAITQDRHVSVIGLVIARQRPGTASGVIFITLEDETGTCNVIVWPAVYETFRRAVIAGRLLQIHGKLQTEGAVQHLIADRVDDISDLLDTLSETHTSSVIVGAKDSADEAKRPVAHPVGRRTTPRARHPREQAKVLFPSRDFH